MFNFWKNLTKRFLITPTNINQSGGWRGMVLGGGVSDSGIDVNYQTAQRVAAVHACVQLIADDISGLPARVIKKNAFGSVRRVAEHPLNRLLNDSPNPNLTSHTYRQLVLRNLLYRGNSFDYVQWVGNRVKAIFPLCHSWVTPTIVGGELFYRVSGGAFSGLVSPANILHPLYLTFDGITGLSPIDVVSQPIGIALASDKYAAKFFGQGTSLAGYLSYPGEMEPEAEAELQRTWAAAYSGIDNVHKVPVLSTGATYNPISITPEQSQMLQQRAATVVECCRLFRVNPVKIGDLSKSSYATYDAVTSDHVTSTLKPWIDRLEQEWSRKLLTEDEKADGYYIEIDPDGLMRGDRQSQDKSFATGIQFGWYSKNDVRDLLNLPPIEGGDEYLSPLNMAPVAPSDEDEPPVTPSDEDSPESEPAPLADTRKLGASRLTPLFQDALKKVLAKEVKAVQRASTRQPSLTEWAEDWYERHEQLVTQAVLPSLTALEPHAAYGRAADYATRHCEQSKQDIKDALTFDALEDLYSRWTNQRPLSITLGDLC